MLLVLCLCSILLTAIIFGIGFGRIASSDIEIMTGCIFAALLLWGSSVPLYLWQLILAFQFGKGAVSYTHLDVYKRQEEYIVAIIALCFRFGVASMIAFISSRDRTAGRLRSLFIAGTDVYKRQG